MPAGDMTFVNFPPQPLCFVSGSSENDWYTSNSSLHFAQRYSYVGIGSGDLLGRVLALEGFEC